MIPAQTRYRPSASGSYQSVVLADGPIAYWPLNDTTGSSVQDVTSSPANATINSGVTLGQPAIAPGLGTCVALNGTSNAIDAGTVSKLAISGAITVEGWAKYTQTNGGNIFSCHYNSGFRVQIGGGLGGGGVNVIFASSNILSTPNNLSQNTLYHVLATASAAGVNIYINGALVANNSYGWGSMDGSAVSLGYTATGSPVEPMGGFLSNVAVYNKVLSPAQVLAHYNAGIA